ncbi:MAG: hypothetical protein L0241_30360, partial [Planctomycetia bacterium]|nr:hypothetical protein [Planctomycetia bacterium]
ITGATNPTGIEKPDLKQLPAFAERFTITDVRDTPPLPDAKEVRFTYKLRPRNRSVNRVPRLEFYYLNRAAAQDKQYPKTAAKSVAITVTEPPVVIPPPPVPLEAPEFLFTNETGPDVLGSSPHVPGMKGWAVMILVGPLVALGWYLVWRRIFPDAARLAKLRRSRAARRALETIRKAARTHDPPATIAAAVLGYLRTRFPLPESASTPSEIASALREFGLPFEVAEQTADVFRACDRARFAPPSDSGLSLASDAENAIVRMEALG